MDVEGDGGEGAGVRGDEEQEAESTKHLCFLFEALEVRVLLAGEGDGTVGIYPKAFNTCVCGRGGEGGGAT